MNYEDFTKDKYHAGTTAYNAKRHSTSKMDTTIIIEMDIPKSSSFEFNSMK